LSVGQSRVNPSNFLTIRSRPNTLQILLAAGVKVGLATADTDNTRNLRWEAGLAREQSSLTFAQTLAAVTTNVADILGIPTYVMTIAAGRPVRCHVLSFSLCAVRLT
jgi:imidazolonepropionase-like amidohydrolase